MAISQQKPLSEIVSTTDSDSSFVDITDLLMTDPKPTSGTPQPDLTVEIPSDEDFRENNATTPSLVVNKEDGFPKNNDGPWFTLDDIPPHQ